MIERNLVSYFEECRQGAVTRWNRLCSRSCKTLLSRFEKDVLCDVDLAQTLGLSSELTAIHNVYTISGFPLHFCWTDVEAICAKVHNTCIHTQSGAGIEFALAVHCVGYANNITSVWVYVASLTRK